MTDLNDIYDEIEKRTTKGDPRFYKPLDEEMSRLIRADYTNRTYLSLEGSTGQTFFNRVGTLMAVGYARIVVGDYGAYIEFYPDQINHNMIKNKFYRGKARPYQKYWWMESCDENKTKVYEQIREVAYADYKPGLFYISPINLFDQEGNVYYK
jgi:hypothetical protein